MDAEARNADPRSASSRCRRSRAVRAGLPLLLLLGTADGCDSRPPGSPEPELDAVRPPPPGGTPRGGGELVRSLGCAACHEGVPDPGTAPIGPPLGPAADHDATFVFSYVLDPAVDGVPAVGPRMPSFHLSAAEALALALYLTADAGTDDAAGRRTTRRGVSGEAERAYRNAREEHPGIDAEVGARVFAALNCGGCHPHPDAAPWRNGPDLALEGGRARPEWLAGWLRSPTAIRPFGDRPGTGGRMPDFGLSPSEADSIATFLVAGARAAGAEAPALASPSSAEREEDGSPSALDPVTAHGRRTAERLLRERLPCLGCHSLNGEGGRIGPDLSTVARRRPADYVRWVVSAPVESAPGTVMPRVPMTDDLRGLVTAYLLAPAEGPGALAADPTAVGSGRVAGEPAAPAGEAGPVAAGHGYLSLVDHASRPPTPAELGRGPADTTAVHTYARRCATCHGEAGRGDGFNARYLPAMPTPHASAAHMATRPSATLFDGVYAGGRILGLSHRMPPFGESLSRERIWDLVAHMRSLCRCRGPAWSRGHEDVPVRVERAGVAGSGEGAEEARPSDGGVR